MLISDFVSSILLQSFCINLLIIGSSFALPSSPPLSSSSPSSSSSINFPICRQDRSVCSSKQESDFWESGGLEINSLLSEPMRQVANDFDDYHRRFNGEVANLLENSKNGFHSMFTRTYGHLYHKHSSIFIDLFDVLKRYYESPSVNLETEFGNFFTNLYKKMFQELNKQYSFTDEYMKCPETYMNPLNPFGDVPKKLIIEFQRSFTAAKVFSQSLKSTSDVIKTVKEQSVTPNCQKHFIQMNYCQRCEASPERIPCHSYCTGVLSLCSSSHKHLNKEWNSHLDKLSAIINRLENSFSIESAVGPLDIKISEAIMNFQENGVNISKKIWQFCGKPKIGKRRAINRHPYDPPSPPTSGSSSYSNFVYAGPGKSPLDQLIDDVKKSLKKCKDLWIKLPETICNSSLPTSTINHEKSNLSKSCWNQSDATSQHQLMDRSEPALEKIEFIKSQRMVLRTINQRLDAAYKGSELTGDDDLDNGNGSGSGDGDYDDYKDYNENDDDDDDPDDDVYKSSTSSPHSSSSSPSTSSNVDLTSSSTIKNDDSMSKSNSTKNSGSNSDNQQQPTNELNQVNSTTAINNNQQSPAQSSNNQQKGSSSLAQQSVTAVILAITLSILSAPSL